MAFLSTDSFFTAGAKITFFGRFSKRCLEKTHNSRRELGRKCRNHYLCRAMQLRNLSDIHTHHAGRADALLSLPVERALAGCITPFSLELHPWKLETSANALSLQLDTFRRAADALRHDPRLMAIGECGLDNHCDVPLAIQITAFRAALATARELDLPVIIHCVGHWAEVMAMVREAGTSANIIHGFRKGTTLATQLLNAGFSIALGEKFNPDVARLVPADRLFFETDESEVDICTIREKILTLRHEIYRT